MNYRMASAADAPLLGEMNYQLIRAEGHRNPMSLVELQSRMASWLVDGYQAVLFEDDGGPAGYVLFRREADHIYLRQLFVRHQRRRQGVGRSAVGWLIENLWHDEPRIRVDVLVGNQAAIEFWRSVGFTDYCLTMERDISPALGGFPPDREVL
jgi:GNAT superfamily N-acetyltransferase